MPRISEESKILIGMSLGLGFSVAIPAALFTVGGNILDQRYGTGNTFLFIGMAVGLAVSLYSVWRIVKVSLHRLEKSRSK